MEYRDYPSRRSTSHHRSRRDDNGRDARNRTRSPDAPRRSDRRSHSRSRDTYRRYDRRSPTPPRHINRRSRSRSPYGDAYRHSRSRSRYARQSSRDRRSDRPFGEIEDRTVRLRSRNDQSEDMVAAMSRQTHEPQEESIGRLEATHIAAKIHGQAGTAFVPIQANGSTYLVPASRSHAAPDNSRWAARSVQNQTILTHCTGKHNTITVPVDADQTGAPPNTNTGDCNYPGLPRDVQPRPMAPVAVPNGGRASTSYAASSARMDQGPADLVQRVQWLIDTTETADGPRPVPASFGRGWPTEGQVFGKKMGLNEQCRPGLCMYVFGFRGTRCPDGRNCPHQHTWLKDEDCRAIIANPLPENGGAKTGIAWLRVAVQHFVANRRLGLVDENHEVPIPPRPGRLLTLPQYEALRARKRSRRQRLDEDGQQTGNIGEEDETPAVEDNTGQENVPIPGLKYEQV